MDSNDRNYAGAMADVRVELAKYIEKQAATAAWDTSAGLAQAVLAVTVPPALAARLRDDLETELGYLSTVAADSVRDEYREQTGDELTARAEFAAKSGDSKAYAKTKAAAEVERAVADVRDQLATFALQLSAPTREEVADLFQRAHNELAQDDATRKAPLVTSEVFNRARQDEAKRIEEMTGKSARIEYSAVLDTETCEECEAADALHGSTGTPIVPGSPEETQYMPPYQKCLGGVRCRCIYVYTW
jgi:hypothetical protein